jgi:hypothetical protein
VRRSAIIAAVLALAACEKADNEPGPGGVTMGEARALDEAAAMIEARRPPADLLKPSPGHPDAVAPDATAAPD